MGSKEYELREALEDWREEKTAEIYGRSYLIDIGPAIVMGNLVLERLVNCAHHAKINSVNDIRKETHWTNTQTFGSEVLSIILRIIPAVPLSQAYTTAPLQRGPISATLNLPPVEQGNISCASEGSRLTTSRKMNKCSRVRLPSHLLP
jgi:hypothetical protein